MTGTNYNRNSAIDNCINLKRKLQIVDFAITDTVLYLDAYPFCKEALEHYGELIKMREALVKEITENGGQVTTHNSKDTTAWNWTSDPWPWQYEAN